MPATLIAKIVGPLIVVGAFLIYIFILRAENATLEKNLAIATVNEVTLKNSISDQDRKIELAGQVRQEEDRQLLSLANQLSRSDDASKIAIGKILAHPFKGTCEQAIENFVVQSRGIN